MSPSQTNTRIDTLSAEVDRLRRNRHQTDNHLQQILLKIAEIQLNLATQDATLSKLDSTINGNGKPGLSTRVDRLERSTANFLKLAWILIAAVITTAADMTMRLCHH